MKVADIKSLCKQIAAEAKCVAKYADCCENAKSDYLKEIGTELRFDSLGHLQKLIVALTEMLTAEEDEDGEDDESGEDDE